MELIVYLNFLNYEINYYFLLNISDVLQSMSK